MLVNDWAIEEVAAAVKMTHTQNTHTESFSLSRPRMGNVYTFFHA